MGFLDGLKSIGSNIGAKLGMGGGPMLTATEKAPIFDARFGALKQMPDIQMGRTGFGGFLDKLNAPDERGLTLADKLGAAGQIMQGDTGGGLSYLQRQRVAADQLAQRDKQEASLARKNAAFKAAYQNGSFNPQVYAEMAGDDDASLADDIAGMEKAFSPNMQFMNAGSDIYGLDPRTGQGHMVAQGSQRIPFGWEMDAEGNPRPMKGGPYDPGYIYEKGAAERKAKPLAGRAPRGGGGGMSGIPAPRAGFRIISPTGGA